MQNHSFTPIESIRSVSTSDPNDFQVDESRNHISANIDPILLQSANSVFRKPWMATAVSNGSLQWGEQTTNEGSTRCVSSSVEAEGDYNNEDQIRIIIKNSESILQDPKRIIRFDGCDYCTQCGRQVGTFGDEFGWEGESSDEEGENS
nr:hypothetical protein [Crucivirus sp.]